MAFAVEFYSAKAILKGEYVVILLGLKFRWENFVEHGVFKVTTEA